MSAPEAGVGVAAHAGRANLWGAPRDTIRGGLLCALLVACPLAYSLELVSFLHAKEAVLALFLVAFGLLGLRRPLDPRGFLAFAPLWLGLGAALIGLLWVPSRLWHYAIEEAVRVAMLLLAVALVAGLIDSSEWRGRLRRTVVGSGVCVSLLALGQYFRLLPFLFPEFEGYDQPLYSVFGNQDALGGYLALALPLSVHTLLRRAKTDQTGRTDQSDHAGGGARGILVAAAAFVLMLAVLVLSGSRSAWLAAFVGIVLVLPYGRMAKRRGLALLLVGAGATGLVAAVTWPRPYERVAHTFSDTDVGGRARLWFWDGTVRMWADHPVAGAGLGTYRYWSPRYLGMALHAPGGGGHFRNELHTRHAHAEPLEYLAETGLAGAVFGIWMLLRLLRCRGSEWGVLGALFTLGLFNASLHGAAHALVGLLFAAMLLLRKPHRPRVSPGPGWAFGTAAAALVLAFAWCHITLAPSYLLRQAEDVYLAGENPLPAYERLMAHPWPCPEGRMEYGMALRDGGQPGLAYEELLEARRGVDTGQVYLLLSMTARDLGLDEAAQDWARECLLRWPDNQDAQALSGREQPALN